MLNLRVFVLLALCAITLVGCLVKSAQHYLDEASKYIVANQLESAIPILQEGIRSHPNEQALQSRLLDVYFDLRDWENYERLVRNGILDDPAKQFRYRKAGDWLYEHNEYVKSIRFLTLVSQLEDPRCSAQFFYLTNRRIIVMNMLLEQRSQARRTYRETLRQWETRECDTNEESYWLLDEWFKNNLTTVDEMRGWGEQI